MVSLIFYLMEVDSVDLDRGLVASGNATKL